MRTIKRGSPSYASCWELGVGSTGFQIQSWMAGQYGELLILQLENRRSLCAPCWYRYPFGFPGHTRSSPEWSDTAPYVKNTHWLNRGELEQRLILTLLFWSFRVKVFDLAILQGKDHGGAVPTVKSGTRNNGRACWLWPQPWTLHCSEDLGLFAHFLRAPVSPRIKAGWW